MMSTSSVRHQQRQGAHDQGYHSSSTGSRGRRRRSGRRGDEPDEDVPGGDRFVPEEEEEEELKPVYGIDEVNPGGTVRRRLLKPRRDSLLSLSRTKACS